MRRLVVVANKWWEVAPLVAVLLHNDARKREYAASPAEIRYQWSAGIGDGGHVTPRLTGEHRGVAIEVWCIQDLISVGGNASSTWEKAQVLGSIIGHQDHIAVIAFGTAASVQD